MADYSPETHLIESLQRQNMTWAEALAEPIDNAFDASASQVVIRLANRVVEISDDGRGCSDLVAMCRPGSHRGATAKRHRKEQIGQYGIGLKDCALFIGDQIEINSICEGIQSTLRIDYQEFQKRQSWIGPDPERKPADGRSGTVIRMFMRAGRNLPSQEVWDKLAWMFTPAMTDLNKQILVPRRRSDWQPEPLRPFRMPILEDVVQDTFTVGGKQVSITIGLLQSGQSIHYGPFWLSHLHRNITHTSLGAGSYSAARLAGKIRLGKGWVLSKNKTLLLEGRDELGEAIFSRIEHLLIKSDSIARDVEVDALKTELEDLLNAAVADAKKEARDKTGEAIGAVLPKMTGRRREAALKVHDEPGSVIRANEKPRRRTGITVGFTDMESDRLAEYDPLSNRVNFNNQHPFVGKHKKFASSSVLYPLALAVLAEHVCTHKDGQITMFPVGDFGTTLGRLLAKLREAEADAKVS